MGNKKEALKLDLILKDELDELVRDYIPSFGRQADIDIRDNLFRLELKNLSMKERNSLMSKTVYLLKTYGKFKTPKI